MELASEYEMQLEFSLRDTFLPVIWVFIEWSCNLSAKVLGNPILQEHQDNKSGFGGTTGVYGWWGASHRRGDTGGALGNEGALWTERGAVATLYYQIWRKRNMFKKDFKEILLCVLWEQQSSEFLQKPSLKFRLFFEVFAVRFVSYFMGPEAEAHLQGARTFWFTNKQRSTSGPLHSAVFLAGSWCWH